MGRTLCRFDLSSSHGVLTKVGATSRSGTYPTLNWVIAVPEDRFVARLLVEIRDAAVCDEAVVVTDEMLSFAINRGIGIMGLRHISSEVQFKNPIVVCCDYPFRGGNLSGAMSRSEPRGASIEFEQRCRDD